MTDSTFTWLSSNVDDVSGKPLFGVPRNVVFAAKNACGLAWRVAYRDPIAVAKRSTSGAPIG